MMIIFCWAKAITSGVDDMVDASSLEKNADREPSVAPKAMEIKQEINMDFLTLSYLRAPIFWAT